MLTALIINIQIKDSNKIKSCKCNGANLIFTTVRCCHHTDNLNKKPSLHHLTFESLGGFDVVFYQFYVVMDAKKCQNFCIFLAHSNKTGGTASFLCWDNFV